jgi:LysM repeat protein
MYGKAFTSMYTGSLFGKPALVFAVWTYSFAHMRPSRKDGECYVELNPTLLAATFATDVPKVHEALAVLEAPDPSSRNTVEDGRRLVCLAERRHDGPMQYRVVNGATYRAMRDEEERRDYLREAKRKERAGRKVTSTDVNNVNHGQPSSTQAEAESDVKKSEPPTAGAKRRRSTHSSSFAEDSVPVQLAVLMESRLRQAFPDMTPPDLQRWAADFDRILRIDGRSEADVRGAIEFAAAHKAKFYRSPGAFREHWKDGSHKWDSLVTDMRVSRRPVVAAFPAAVPVTGEGFVA